MTRSSGSGGRRRRPDWILVLNAGSSTLKASLLRRGVVAPVAAVTVGWDGDPVAVAGDALDRVLAALGDPPLDGLLGVGHRVVHGGPDLTHPVVIDDATIAAIEAVVPLAPLHDPPAIAVIQAVTERAPGVRQVAGFDTAFHARMPEATRRYPVPVSWTAAGIRRYGFHGLSVEWSVIRAAELLDRPVRDLRVVVAHLGAGASVTAVDRGRGVQTSMGFTPLEGLMMATRSGSIDPGIIFDRVRAGETIADVEEELVHHSGLLAVGGTADMRALVERAATGDAEARLAVAMFADRAAAEIAASASRLPELDALVFTGGIGENAAGVRADIVRRLAVLGIAPVARRAISRDAVLSRPDVRPAVLRVTAREDLVIAAAVQRTSGRG